MPTANILPMGSTPAKNGFAGQARLTNCYVESIDQGAATFSVIASDGLATLVTFPAGGAIRAIHTLPDLTMLVAAGRVLYSVDIAGTATMIGGIPSDGLVTMARNREADPRVAICCDGTLYFWQSGTVTKMTEFPDGFSPIAVTHLNGYFVFITAGGNVFHSEVDSATIPALAYDNASSNPDRGIMIWARGPDLCVGGEKTIEFERDVGGDPYAFSFTTSAPVGVLAAATVATVGETSMFAGHDNTVRLLDGYSPVIVSTPEISRWIESEEKADLQATAWAAHGHIFYSLSGADETWVYDITTKQWHCRESHGEGRWRVSCVEMRDRTHVAGDYESATIYQMSQQYKSENGTPLVMRIESVPIADYPYKITHRALHLDMMRGVGIVTADEVPMTADDGEPLLADDGEPLLVDVDPDPADLDPVVMVTRSDNGGPFGGERTRPLGRVGQSGKKVSIHGLGMSENRTYRIAVPAAVERMMIGAKLDYEVNGK